MYISLWENYRGHPDNISFMQFSTKIDGFEQKDSQGSENSYNSYEQYPLENFFIFTIYQNYTLALIYNCTFTYMYILYIPWTLSIRISWCHGQQIIIFPTCKLELRFNTHYQYVKQRLCLSSFPRVETRFNTHYQNAYANAFRNDFLELSLSSHSIANTSREEGLVTAQLHCAVWPVEQRSCRAHAFM